MGQNKKKDVDEILESFEKCLKDLIIETGVDQYSGLHPDILTNIFMNSLDKAREKVSDYFNVGIERFPV